MGNRFWAARRLADYASYMVRTGLWCRRWLQSYAVLVPAKLYKPIWKYDIKTLWKDLSAHLVYGFTTATTFRALAAGTTAPVRIRFAKPQGGLDQRSR